MDLIDISLKRESACPVHFIWDGNGLGRPLVRLGFMLAVMAALLATGAVMVHHDGVRGAALVVAACAAGTWTLGQLLTRFSLFRSRAR